MTSLWHADHIRAVERIHPLTHAPLGTAKYIFRPRCGHQSSKHWTPSYRSIGGAVCWTRALVGTSCGWTAIAGARIVHQVARLKMLREPSGRVRYLSDEEESRFMEKLSTDEDRQRVTVLLHTGLRKAEFLGLRWRDVDFKAGVVTVPRSKNGEARHVPMTSTVRAVLATRPRTLDREALVFPNSEGKHDLRGPRRPFLKPWQPLGSKIPASMTFDTRSPLG